MQFLKKHYEKIILSLVLLGLAVAAFMLTVKVQSVKQDLEEKSRRRTASQKAPLNPAETVETAAAIERLSKPMRLEYGGVHNLANPMRWIKNKSGEAVPDMKGIGAGPKGLSIVRMNPLNLNINFERVAGEGDDLRYQFTIEKQFAKKADQRRKTIASAKVGAKTQDNTFTLREVRPSKEAPTELAIELVDTGEPAVVGPGKSFSKVFGYSADLRHELERKDFPSRRVGDTINLDGVAYKIVAITRDEVVVSDPVSHKRTIVRASR